MHRRVWKAVETEAGKIMVAEIERGKEARRKKRKEGKETQKNKNMEDSRRVGDLGRGSSKIGRGGKEVGTREIS